MEKSAQVRVNLGFKGSRVQANVVTFYIYMYICDKNEQEKAPVYVTLTTKDQ